MWVRTLGSSRLDVRTLEHQNLGDQTMIARSKSKSRGVQKEGVKTKGKGVVTSYYSVCKFQVTGGRAV